MEDTKIGNLRGNVEQVNGKAFQVVLQEVKLELELWVNFLALKGGQKEWYKD
jgi:hypothetical protein